MSGHPSSPPVACTGVQPRGPAGLLPVETPKQKAEKERKKKEERKKRKSKEKKMTKKRIFKKKGRIQGWPAATLEFRTRVTQ